MEYTALSIMVGVLFILVSAAVNWQTGICYLVGASTNAFCGYVGMMIATIANVKTAAAAESGLNAALRVAFRSGMVMGLTVVSVAMIMLSIMLMSFQSEAIEGMGAMAGVGMGTSTVAIFARVGGGIFTKAADVGGDLVGKVEKDLPEDDIRNPATIADNGMRARRERRQRSTGDLFPCALYCFCCVCSPRSLSHSYFIAALCMCLCACSGRQRGRCCRHGR